MENYMTSKKENRKGKDRRENDDKHSESYIDCFIPEDEEQRSGTDRRKPKKQSTPPK